MLYSTDGSAAGQAARLLDENASVPLKIAQSVEKQLPQNESWFASGAAACGKDHLGYIRSQRNDPLRMKRHHDVRSHTVAHYANVGRICIRRRRR